MYIQKHHLTPIRHNKGTKITLASVRKIGLRSNKIKQMWK
jgi:hypothetical protein